MSHHDAMEIALEQSPQGGRKEFFVANHEAKKCADPDHARESHKVTGKEARPAASLWRKMEKKIAQDQCA